MELDVGCTLNYRCTGPGTLILAVHPYKGGRQQILDETLYTQPYLHQEYFLDWYGNRLVRLKSGGGAVHVTFQALIRLELQTLAPEKILEQIDPGDLPTAVVPFLYPSRYCPSDRLYRLAQDLFGHFPMGYERVLGICTWIHNHIEFRYGSSDTHTSATDTLIDEAGVCRDFAHLGIAFCRALGIPARFVAGYAYNLDPADFHAYFEVYLSGGWYIFDATNKAPRGSLVPIALGHDAADTSFANLFGNVSLENMEVWSHWVTGDVTPTFLAHDIPVPTNLEISRSN